LAILDIFKARRMSDCSSCNWPPCLATVAGMWKTYKKLVAASNNEIRLLALPYMLPQPPATWLKPVLSTHKDAYQEFHQRKSQNWQHHQIWFWGLWGQMCLQTMEVSHYGQWEIGDGGFYRYPAYVIRFFEGPLPWSWYINIHLHAASDSCCFWSYGSFLNMHSGLYNW
jgi:hypothetical protein